MKSKWITGARGLFLILKIAPEILYKTIEELISIKERNGVCSCLLNRLP